MSAAFDVIVIGLGPGSEHVAGELAKAGKRVLGIDKNLVGGECPYYGCIPSKMFIEAAARGGDFTEVADRIRDEATDDWDDAVAVRRLEDAGGTFVRGAARIEGRTDGLTTVAVGDQRFTAPVVVLGTGTDPAIPPVDGLADLGDLRWTNREIVKARAVPKSLAVIGGGAIGCELAQAFARFGARVSIVEAGARILGPEEPEASEVIATVFAREGITVHQNVAIKSVTRSEHDALLSLADGTLISAERVLVAAGRRPNIAGLGLPSVGIEENVRSLPVDDHMQVADGLYAVGDITGKGAFTHVSMWQANVLIAHLLGRPENFGGYHGLAWATFTDPEVGRVGMTEQQARDAGLRVRVGTQQIGSNTRGWIQRADGFVKVVADADRDVLVGATVVAPHGGEILGLLTLAVHAAVPLDTLRSMHYAYPTLHRAVSEAIAALSP